MFHVRLQLGTSVLLSLHVIGLPVNDCDSTPLNDDVLENKEMLMHASLSTDTAGQHSACDRAAIVP